MCVCVCVCVFVCAYLNIPECCVWHDGFFLTGETEVEQDLFIFFFSERTVRELK